MSKVGKTTFSGLPECCCDCVQGGPFSGLFSTDLSNKDASIASHSSL